MRGVSISGKLCSFRHHDNGKIAPALVALADRLGNLVDVERTFGDQDYVSATRDATVHGDPAFIAAHHFNHHHAVVCLGGGVNPVNGFTNHVDRSIKAEGEVGPGEIVVNSLGNAHHLHPALV